MVERRRLRPVVEISTTSDGGSFSGLRDEVIGVAVALNVCLLVKVSGCVFGLRSGRTWIAPDVLELTWV